MSLKYILAFRNKRRCPLFSRGLNLRLRAWQGRFKEKSQVSYHSFFAGSFVSPRLVLADRIIPMIMDPTARSEIPMIA